MYMTVATSEDMGKTMSTAEVTEQNEQKKSPFRKLLARLHLWPHSSEKMTLKKSKKKEDSTPPRPPLKTPLEEKSKNESEWKEVPLQVAEISSAKSNPIVETPVPPPRKNRVRNQDSIESIEAVHISENMQPESPQPVLEPIIKAQKVIEHVCDGTHHHVHNVVNGKIIDEYVVHKHDVTNQSQEQNLKVSSLSLPSYIDSKKKEEKRRPDRPSKNKKKSSSSSLPTDKKTKTNSAAERIESYIRRWKSVSSFRPHKNKQKEEKTKPVETEPDKNSENSWGGLEDWDVGVIENDIHPYGSDIKQQTNKITSTPKLKEEKIAEKFNNRDIDRFISYVEKDTSNMNRISVMTDISSDTCKDFAEPNDMPELSLQQEKPVSYQMPEPLKRKRTIDKNIEATSEFLKQEALASDNLVAAKHLKMAPLATFDSDRDINKLLNTNEPAETKYVVEENNKNISLSHILGNEPHKKNRDLQKGSKGPVKIPRKKTIGHSNLLRFMKETNVKVNDNASESNINFSATIGQEKTLNDHDNNTVTRKININNENEIVEPEIIPEIRSVENMWNELVLRDDAGKLSSMLELESAVSDSLDNSSESTIVDAGIKCN